ncbi:MAG: DUF5011 domain-containing protein [Candidatus Peribacteria bacterium]|jgi:hypothetical protein|nr:DUF5011 domain-containing protein [Candidatus Peribacteria bacterium]
MVTLSGANPQQLEVKTPYVELGATANDAVDGSLPVTINSGSVNMNQTGDYTVSYSAMDSVGNIGSITRTIQVRDTTKPIITLSGSGTVYLEVGDPYVEYGATVRDNYDNNIVNKLVISGTVDTSIKGTYQVSYDVTDSDGNQAETKIRTVYVMDGTSPIVLLSGANPQYVEVKTPYIEFGATAYDAVDGSLSVTINSGEVNINQTGTYYVYYTAVDTANNTGNIQRTVIVKDTTKPIITLLGSGTVYLEVGDPYVEYGATVRDNYDTDIANKLVISGTVDT